MEYQCKLETRCFVFELLALPGSSPNNHAFSAGRKEASCFGTNLGRMTLQIGLVCWRSLSIPSFDRNPCAAYYLSQRNMLYLLQSAFQAKLETVRH
jgi:hypothetical protein